MNELHQLVNAAKQQDQEAYCRLVIRFQDMAYAMAYGLVKDAYLAEDAAQEAFIEAYYQLPHLRNPAAFPGWFRRIVYKHSDRMLRRRQLITVPIETSVDIPVAAPGPIDDMESSELQQIMHNAIESLPDHERVVMSAFYITGYSYAEISTWLEIPVSTVKKRLHDARKRLKERLNNMVNDYIEPQRPSQDTLFADQIALFLAIRTGATKKAENLLKKNTALANAREDRKETLFYFIPPLKGPAAEEWKAQMRTGLGDGWAPLHWAATIGHLESVKLLLDYGSDIDLSVFNGGTPLALAAWYGFSEIVELLVSKGAQVDDGLGQALLANHPDIVTFLIDHGADVNACGGNGFTPLHLMAMNGRYELAAQLINHGAKTNIQDKKGRTPLYWAEKNGHNKVAELLRKK